MSPPPSVLIFSGIQVVISAVVIIFNVIGIYLLSQPNTFQHNQKVCLIHLSVIKVLFMIAQNIPLFLDISGVDPSIIELMWLLILCGLVVPWCNIMFVFTIDRCIQVLLNTKYAAYIKSKKTTKFVIFLCWLVGVICLTAIMIAKYKLDVNPLRIMHMFVIQIYHAIIIITFICTYLYVLYRIKKGSRSPARNSTYNHRGAKKISSMSTATLVSKKMSISDTLNAKIREKNNFVPFWIVISYIFFVMVPEVLHYSMFHGEIKASNTSAMALASMILFDFDGLSECLLYILMNTSTKQRFLEMMNCKKRRERRHTTEETEQELSINLGERKISAC